MCEIICVINFWSYRTSLKNTFGDMNFLIKYYYHSFIIHSNKRLIYDYRRANFEGLRKRLTDNNLCSMLTNNGPECSIDDDWSTWKNSVMYAMNEFVPTKCVDSRRIISIISKPLERCVLNHISHRIQSTIHSAQYGFVSGRSSTAQLLSTLQTIRKNLDKGLQTDVVFMDISKAFDTVDHAILLQKHRDFGISGSLLLWFENHLYQDASNGWLSSVLPPLPCQSRPESDKVHCWLLFCSRCT